jgi:hypothetical protein
MPVTEYDKTELEQNLTSRNTWMRLIYMLLFGFIFWLSSMVLVVVVVLQFLHVLIAGKGNDNLSLFGGQLGVYFRQIIDFLCYNDEQQPFPFGDWPNTGGGTRMAPAEKPARAKTSKKKTSRKKTSN